MPVGRVILEGGGIAELRSWKPFGQWVNTFRRASQKSVPSGTRTVRCKKIITFIQGVDTLSKRVMEDLSSDERGSVGEKSSSMILSLLKT